jgi:hypothetical protein
MEQAIYLTPEQIEALSEVLDLAHGDQESYMSIGNPHIDYGNEWPFVARTKAMRFRDVAAVGRKLGINGEFERWEKLAYALESSANEY